MVWVADCDFDPYKCINISSLLCCAIEQLHSPSSTSINFLLYWKNILGTILLNIVCNLLLNKKFLTQITCDLLCIYLKDSFINNVAMENRLKRPIRIDTILKP